MVQQAISISGQASICSNYLWDSFLIGVLFISYSFFKQQQRYNIMRKRHSTKLKSLHQELAFKIKLEQEQNVLFYNEMTGVKKSFNSFTRKNELELKRLQLFDVVRICLNSMEIYLRVWKQL
jgi:hypothetical protein